MARIQPVDREQAHNKSRQLMDAAEKKLGVVPNLLRTMAHSPAVLQSYLDFSAALTGAELTAAQREQIAVAVAAKNDCGYCLAAHTAIGKGAGVSDADLASAQTGDVSDPVTSAAITLARSVVEKRGWVDASELDAARWAGLSEGQILEVIATVVLNILTNYINHAVETEIDFPKVENRLTATA